MVGPFGFELCGVYSNSNTEKLLKTTKVDVNVAANRKAHHTDLYETEGLIIRRGQAFDVTVEFDRAVDNKKDDVHIILRAGQIQ